MPRPRKTPRKAGRAGAPTSPSQPGDPNLSFGGESPEPITAENAGLPLGETGRSIIILRPGNQKSLAKALRDSAGLAVASSSDFADAELSDADLAQADGVILEHLNIAIVDAKSPQIMGLQAAVADESNPVLTVEPEVYVFPLCAGSEGDEDGATSELLTRAGREYLSGYIDALQALRAQLLGGGAAAAQDEFGVAETFFDTPALTWGLQATNAHNSRCNGRGMRVAVLDTGMDLNHPDFAGRGIISASFVPNQTVQDAHSHGTHCIGTACGPRVPMANARRYGVAPEATILAGKVLSNQGSGQSG